MSDDMFIPLSKPLLTHNKILRNSEPPSDLLAIMNTELRSILTLRSLVNLCVACKLKPTAQMLAFALQNSIPSLTGLPMDNPDPGFYINVAKGFYDKQFASIEHKVKLYRRVHNYYSGNEFFPRGRIFMELTLSTGHVRWTIMFVSKFVKWVRAVFLELTKAERWQRS